MHVKIGTCGFSVGRKKYFKFFKIVEIQKTFYDFVKEETLNKWREEAPSDFEFSFKVIQLLTHPLNSPTYRRMKDVKKFKENSLKYVKSWRRFQMFLGQDLWFSSFQSPLKETVQTRRIL
ncbi:MAG: hypothetical protein DRI28_06745 [Caldiserica bacterium]|nr:MAG: hypothetical protein DRI28_06745 [Caldisericota bacterium]